MRNANLTYNIEFKGKGNELFGIQIVNWLLTIVTLGIYYPWAKADVLKYEYQKTELCGSSFTFHGTGKEMFIGFLKGFAILGILYGVLAAGTLTRNPALTAGAYLFFFTGLAFLLPIAIHGRMRYRASRSSWRGIYFGYRGELKRLYSVCLKGVFLTIITFGFYSSWFTVALRKEVIGNIRFGDVKFSFEGTGAELFVLRLKGLLLTFFTLGIYLFWYLRDLHNFYANNVMIEQHGSYSKVESTVTGSGYFRLLAGNLLIIVFTLGLGSPWATVRTFRFIFSNMEVFGMIDFDSIAQTEPQYQDATMEDVSDILNLDLV